MLDLLNKQEIIDHALTEFPRESCGLVLNIAGKPRFRRCKNIAENQNDFVLDPLDYVRCEEDGDIIAVVHSHCVISCEPSQADLVGCEKTGLPWIIVGVPNISWKYFEPSGYKAPLVGRIFSHGILDCYSLIRDWYLEERGIALPDFDRRNEWWKKGQNLYLENFEKAGFEKANDDLMPGDCILMQISSDVPNHAAIYLGNDIIIHHVQGRLSCREVFGGFWKKNTRLVVRFKGGK